MSLVAHCDVSHLNAGRLLGDPHNFGRRVRELDDGTLEKPRTIGWEWLFLSKESPLRIFLSDVFSRNSTGCPFDLFEDVEFFSSDPGLAQGRVERIHWDPGRFELSSLVCQQVGSVIALISWFGIGDIHAQNMALGTSKSGGPICMPLDIECIFDDYQLPSQTFLLHPKHNATVQSGLSSLLPFLNNSLNPLKSVAGI
ncbi:hypothetical protein WDW37_03795 [Bdellovibrionota bacterium FG-1]